MTANINIPEHIFNSIREIGKTNNISQIILFGSRARGTNSQRSDIDLAFSAASTAQYFAVADALESIDTLLHFDLVDLNSISLSPDLRDEIKKDGIIIYEKI